MKLIDNLSEKLVDDLRVTMQRDSRVSIAAACFSVYAYEELKAQLENIDELRFLFTSPTFLQEKTAKARRGVLHSPPQPRKSPARQRI